MKNVLLIVVDCLGQFFLDGAKRSSYPFLDSLFNQGLSFTQCVSVSTTTSPSVASILTGTYPIRHGIKTLAGARLNAMVPSLAQEMAKRGYNTYAEVTGPLYPELGLGRGFLEYNHRGKSSYLASEWGRELCGRIHSGGLRRPWFLFLHLWELHQPRWARDKHPGDRRVSLDRALRSLDGVLAETLGRCLDLDDTVLILTGDHGERTERNTLDRVLRLGLVRSYDVIHRIGLPQHWKTLMNRRWRLGHGFHLAEELIRVPLLIVDRGRVPQGGLIKVQTSHVDILPMLGGLLGLPDLGQEADGIDMLEFHRRELTMPQRPAYMQASGLVLPNPRQWLEGIRWNGYKYIRHSGSEGSRVQWLYKVGEGFEERAVRDESICAAMREELERFTVSRQMPLEESSMSREESELIARRLRDLGYM